MRIVELLIDLMDEGENVPFVGIDGVALVKRPAHEENWLAFSEPKKPIWERLTPEEMYKLGCLLGELGEPAGQLEEEGFEIISVKKIDANYRFSVGDISSKPNEPSAEDTVSTRTRYKYVGPQDFKNRDFCAAMMRANRVYRIEDIDAMSNNMANPDFGMYDIFTYRGSYNCRHDWVELIYAQVDPKKTKTENRILVKADRKRNLEGGQYLINAPTETRQTAAAKARRERMGSEQFESFTDYPQYMSDAAQVALNFIEETGNPNDCMTQVGKVRAQQLAQRKPISLETMKRMKNYITRHMGDLDSSKDYDQGCGKLAMASWGCRTKDECSSAEKWLDTRINREEMSIDVNGLEPYVNQTGRTVTEPTVQQFNMNDDKMEITGAAMVPDKLIIRRDALGREFYVYFSKETIKTLSQKFLKDRMTNSVNIEHTDTKADETYVVESWLVSDENMDKSKSLGLNYPEGTWVITMKTDSPKVWAEIKDGQYEGFSVEGYFTEKLVMSKDDLLVEGIKQIVKDTKL